MGTPISRSCSPAEATAIGNPAAVRGPHEGENGRDHTPDAAEESSRGGPAFATGAG